MPAADAQAQAIGFMRMPSTIAQYVGCGYGAGHHAPIVRTPLQRPAYVQRVTIVPAYQGPLYPAGYAPIGCYGGNCYTSAPWGMATPSLAPMQTPPMASPENGHAWRNLGP